MIWHQILQQERNRSALDLEDFVEYTRPMLTQVPLYISAGCPTNSLSRCNQILASVLPTFLNSINLTSYCCVVVFFLTQNFFYIVGCNRPVRCRGKSPAIPALRRPKFNCNRFALFQYLLFKIQSFCNHFKHPFYSSLIKFFIQAQLQWKILRLLNCSSL